MGEQKPLKINARWLKMEKWVSSKNATFIAKNRYKVKKNFENLMKRGSCQQNLSAMGLIFEPHRRVNI